MQARIARTVERFKQSWSRELEDEAIERACREAGHEWRDRKLGPVTTVRLFMLQILWGNTACNHVPRLAGLDVTGSAYCEARGRLPLEVLQTLLTRCTTRMALLTARNVHAILRAHQKLLIDFTPGRPHAHPARGKGDAKKGLPRSRWIKTLGCEDQIVDWLKPVDVPAWMSAEAFAALPETLRMRELRYRVARPGFRVREVTLATTLLDAEVYTKDDLAEAYGLRWTVETCFAHLKTTMKMDVLRCETVRGVTKELTMFLLVYNLVRMTMLEAARRQSVPADRISFVDALRWLANARPGEELPQLVVTPSRPGRYEPRARKRRPKEYDLLNKPRAVLREALRQQSLAA